MKQICKDLEDQYQELDDLVSELDEGQWHVNTPFFDWSIFDEVAHIAFFDHEALLVMEDLPRFRERAKGIMKLIKSDESWPTYTNPKLGAKSPEELLLKWRDIRSCLIQRLNTMDPGDRLSWYGPDMSARSFATARLMETWAHSQDVFDALRIKRMNSNRLCHVAHIGATTFGWSFIARGLKAPKIKPRIKLAGPGGDIWEWGDAGEAEKVWGSAEEFCLVVTQRRNIADTELKWQGKHVSKWLAIAQAFAGVPQSAPDPGVRKIDYNKVTLKN